MVLKVIVRTGLTAWAVVLMMIMILNGFKSNSQIVRTGVTAWAVVLMIMILKVIESERVWQPLSAMLIMIMILCVRFLAGIGIILVLALCPIEPPVQWILGLFVQRKCVCVCVCGGLKQPEPEADHSLLSGAKTKNICSCVSTSLYIFMAWCLIEQVYIFTVLRIKYWNTKATKYCNNLIYKVGIWTVEIVRFQVLTAASMKITVFWDVALCSLVEIDWCFRGASGHCPDVGGSKHHEMSFSFCETIWCNIPEDSHVEIVFYLTFSDISWFLHNYCLRFEK
jgi:hypothetical protein